MGSRGDCYDNVITESFFATLECELLARSTFRTHTQARTALFAYIEGFYNPIAVIQYSATFRQQPTNSSTLRRR